MYNSFMAKRQPCHCGHSKSLHYPPTASSGRKLYPCRLDGCKCKNFAPGSAESAEPAR